MTTKQLLYTGTASAIVFWLSNIIAAYIHGNYNFLSNTVSELGALGTKSHQFMTVCMYISGIFGVIFALTLIAACVQLGINVIPALTAFSIPFTTLWAAWYPMGTPEHSETGWVVFIIYIGVILSLFLWREPKLKTMRIFSGISLVLLMLIFLRFTPFFANYEGLAQRFAHMGWSVWFVSINIQFVKFFNNKISFKNAN